MHVVRLICPRLLQLSREQAERKAQGVPQPGLEQQFAAGSGLGQPGGTQPQAPDPQLDAPTMLQHLQGQLQQLQQLQQQQQQHAGMDVSQQQHARMAGLQQPAPPRMLQAPVGLAVNPSGSGERGWDASAELQRQQQQQQQQQQQRQQQQQSSRLYDSGGSNVGSSIALARLSTASNGMSSGGTAQVQSQKQQQQRQQQPGLTHGAAGSSNLQGFATTALLSEQALQQQQHQQQLHQHQQLQLHQQHCSAAGRPTSTLPPPPPPPVSLLPSCNIHVITDPYSADYMSILQHCHACPQVGVSVQVRAV